MLVSIVSKSSLLLLLLGNAQALSSVAPSPTVPSGTGLLGSFLHYGTATSMNDFDPVPPTSPVTEQFCSVVQTVNFLRNYPDDPLKYYVLGTYASYPGPVTGIDAPAIIDSGSFFPVDTMFNTKMTGLINIPAGDRVFCLTHDDGARLIIGGTTLVDFPGATAETTTCSAAQYFTAGLYPITVLQYEIDGAKVITMTSGPPNEAQVLVPETDLYPDLGHIQVYNAATNTKYADVYNNTSTCLPASWNIRVLGINEENSCKAPTKVLIKLYDSTTSTNLGRQPEKDAPYFWAGDDGAGDVFDAYEKKGIDPLTVNHVYCVYADQYYGSVVPLGELKVKTCFTYTGVCA